MRSVRLAAASLVCTALAAADPGTPHFAPDPPPLGASLASRPLPTDGAPPELGAFIADMFYAPLLERFASGRLEPSLRARLDAYRATKTALESELRARIDTLRDADAASRRQVLQVFSREQTPRILALEETAEGLRRDLVAGAERSPLPAGADLLRYVAVYQPALSADQRRLLLEAAMLEGEDHPAPATGHGVCFSPEGARITVPADAAEGTARAVAAYALEKEALRNELRAAVAAPGGPAPTSLHELARQQAPRLERLEQTAENIRVELARRKDPAQPPSVVALSPDLQARIGEYRREKLALQRALLAEVERITTAAPGGPGVQDRVRETIAAFTRTNADRYAALEKKRDRIRADLARLAPAAAAGASADNLLRDFSDALREVEFWRSYRDYQIAALQPGLSPPQRRLLFAAGLERLYGIAPSEPAPLP